MKKQSKIEDIDSWKRPDIPSKCTWHLHTKEKSPHNHIKKDFSHLHAYDSILDAIGQSPLVRLHNIESRHNLKCKLYAKCEFLNVFGSVKDRIGYRMVIEAEAKGILKPGSTLIEPTSGNTGIGIAAAAAVKGYKCIIVLPEKMSNEKVDVLKALGAKIYRTPTAAAFDHPGIHEYLIDSNIRVAQKLQKTIKDSVILNQYVNSYNPIAHYDTTGEEIIVQCQGEKSFDLGKLDYVVLGAGTGGTLTGISRKIKEKVPNSIDPVGSSLAPPHLNKNEGQFYEVEGIGYEFDPTVCDKSLVDQWIKVDDSQALPAARELIRYEALMSGASSGTALFGAIQVASNLTENETCVVILPDTVRNYMTKFLNDDWMIQRGFLKPNISPCFDEVLSKNVSALDIKIVNYLSLNNTFKQIFSILVDTNFEFDVPVIDSKKFVGVVQASIINRIVEDEISLDATVATCMTRLFSKTDYSSTSLLKLFYMFKTVQTVFFVEKIKTENEEIETYRGQIQKSSFLLQLFSLLKINNDIENFE